MKYIARIITVIVLTCLFATSSWAGVTFKNNGASGTSFKGSDLKHLTATISLPKKLKDYKFDQVRVLLRLSHLDVDGIIYSDRADIPATWANSSAITVNMIAPDGKSEFEDASGGSFGLKDFTSTPQQQKLSSMTATVQIKVFTKTGEKWQTYWDKMARAWKSSSRPVYNAGTVITEGTMTVTLDKLTAYKDINSVILMEFPDDAWSGDVFTRKDLPGERSRFTEVRLTRVADTKIPVDAAVTAFAFDLNDWPELKDKGWAGLKHSVKSDFSNMKNDAQLGWNRIVSSHSIGKERADQVASGVWSEATVAGQPGLKAQFVEKETYNIKLYAPLYLTVRPPYVIAAWHSFKDGYYDKKTGRDVKLSPAQRQEITASLEQVIAGIKPLRGTPPAEIWAPKADAAGGGEAGQKSSDPASESPFKVGDQVMALDNMYKWASAKVVKVQLNHRKQYDYQVQFEGSPNLKWVKSTEIKAGSDSSRQDEQPQQKSGDKIKGIFKGFF